MTPVAKTALALLALCMAMLFGVSRVHNARSNSHWHRLVYSGRNGRNEEVVQEYHRMMPKHRENSLVQAYYQEARSKVGDATGFDLLPTAEPSDFIALAVFAFGMFAFWLWLKPSKARRLYSKPIVSMSPDSPTEGQLSFIRRFNNGIVPVGLTKDAATRMIKEHLSMLGNFSKSQRVDVSLAEFMTGSKSYREKIRLERERKRAQEKLARQQEQERRRQERDMERARKAADKLYGKRIAEEGRLIKAREESDDRMLKKRLNAKAQTILEFQNLVNDILADKRIDAQEVRQLKAWLLANRNSPADFARMIKLIDESLLDGIIDEEETQAIYEGVIDCLITLRERRNA